MFSFAETQAFCEENNLQLIPLVNADFRLPSTIGDLLKLAEGPSLLNAQAKREGIVLRTTDRKVSFKAISNAFLEDED